MAQLTHRLELYYPQGAEADRKPRVYVSSSRRDAHIVGRLTERLEERGVEVVGDRNLDSGIDWRRAATAQMRDADAVVVVVNERLSPWVEEELLRAEDEHTSVIPVIFGDAGLPSIFDRRSSIRARSIADIDSVADQIADSLED